MYCTMLRNKCVQGVCSIFSFFIFVEECLIVVIRASAQRVSHKRLTGVSEGG